MITEFAKAVYVRELDIFARSRKGSIVDIREMYWLLLYNNGFSYNEIGRLSERTHATIMSGVRKVKNLLELGDKEVLRIYELTKHIKR